MMLTFPMLNGIGLVGAGANAERLTKAMLPVITLNGTMCFLFTGILTTSQSARAHPAAVTAAAVAGWLGVYAWLETKGMAFAGSASMGVFAVCATAAALAATYWLWPPCAADPVHAAVRAGGWAGVMEGWVTIVLFAASLAIFFGFAHRFQDAHATIGRLAALPMVPLFGLYTVATVVGSDPAALAKLEALRSMVLVGWTFAMVFAVVFARYVVRASQAGSGTAALAVALIAGWALCLGCIVASAKIAFAGCGPSVEVGLGRRSTLRRFDVPRRTHSGIFVGRKDPSRRL
ncbi:MAG: hypothetical protein HC868_03685 [Sphingomonadales bacterium]|nr:hypothetical protein [Sphingomonadales bacterium]